MVSLTSLCIVTTVPPNRRSETPCKSLLRLPLFKYCRTKNTANSIYLRVYAGSKKIVTRVQPSFHSPQTGGCPLTHRGQLTLHSTEVLLAFTPARPIWSHGSLAQFLKSCSMAMWRTWSWDAKESFSCTATESCSNTSERESEIQRMRTRADYPFSARSPCLNYIFIKIRVLFILSSHTELCQFPQVLGYWKYLYA